MYMARKNKRRLKDIARAMNELVQEREEIKIKITDGLLKYIMTDEIAMLLDDCSATELREVGNKMVSILPEMINEIRSKKTGNKQVDKGQEEEQEPVQKARDLFAEAVIPDEFAEKYGRIITPAPGSENVQDSQPLRATRAY